MRETIRTCDRCGVDSRTKPEMELLEVTVGIKKGHFGAHYSGSYYSVDNARKDIEADWCRECCEHVGFTRTKDKEPVPTTPTLEELMQEVIRTALGES